MNSPPRRSWRDLTARPAGTLDRGRMGRRAPVQKEVRPRHVRVSFRQAAARSGPPRIARDPADGQRPTESAGSPRAAGRVGRHQADGPQAESRVRRLLGVVAAPLRRVGWLPETKLRHKRRRTAGALPPSVKSKRAAAENDSAASASPGFHWQASNGSRYIGRSSGFASAWSTVG